jgi:hypothetical protein
MLTLVCGATASEFPVGSTISERFFEVSRELYGRKMLDGLEYSEPWGINNSNESFENPLTNKYNALANELDDRDSIPRLSAELWLVESARFNDEDKNHIKAFPSLDITFGRRFSAHVLYRIDGELDDDPRYDGKSWKGVAGMAENSTINYKDGPFSAGFGIERISWGYGEYGNLMFSDQAMPMPVLEFGYRRWVLEYRSVIGFLSPLKDQLDQMNGDTSFFTSQQRYLSAHSITIRPYSNFSVSVREAVLFGGPGRRLEPAYVFPLVWYHGEQLNSRMDDNTMFSLAADYRIAGRVWTYGEVLVDDYQADKNTRGDYEPNQLGYIGGLEIYDLPAERCGMAFEYARVNNWTYNQARAHNRYINLNFPIGFPDGPDVDIVSWRLWRWQSDFIKIIYSGSYKRHGEGRIDTPWSKPWLDSDHYSEPFPTGTAEKSLTNTLRAMILWKNGIWSNLRLDFTDIDNVANIPGADDRIWEFHMDIGIKLPPFRWEL